MRLSLLLMAFGGSLAQSSVVPSWSVGGITPDLPLILTALIALRRGPEAGCLVGFAAGLLQDATGGGLLGVQALSRALAGFAMGLLPGRLWVGHPLVQIPGDVILIARVMGLLSGIGRTLDSQTDLIESLIPYLEEQSAGEAAG